jgi:hypothetical protein
MPASATHLGCGDNWNFPQGKTGGREYKMWAEFVTKMYKTGLSFPKIGNAPNVLALVNLIGKNEGVIPDLFLTALTFEKKFTQRIIDTLP